MNYFYLKKIEKFSDIINGKVDYAYFVNPDNMAQIIINDMWNIYYNYIINDNRFPDKTILSEMSYNNLMDICDQINQNAIMKVTNNIIPMFVNQFVFKQDDPKYSNKIAKAYLKERVANMMVYYSKMMHFFPELPKGYDESADLMSSTSYSNEISLDQLVANNLTNIKKYINNSFICSLTLKLNKVNLYKVLSKKTPNSNVIFNLPLSVDILNKTDVNILILLKGITDTCNDFVTETKINTPLIIDEANNTVPSPQITNKYISTLLQLNDIIAYVNAQNAASKKKIDLSDPATNNINNPTPQDSSNFQYQIYIIITILIFLFLSSSCVSCLFIYKKNK